MTTADQLPVAAATDEAAPLKRRVLDTAMRLVEEAGGLRVSLEHLALDHVIREAGVSRTSVYREWPSKDAFYLDLLCELAGPSWQGTAAFDEETIKLTRDVVAERLHLLGTPDGRWRLIREAVRQAARQNFLAVVDSTQWHTYVTLTATAMSLPDEAQERVRASLHAAESVFVSRMSNFYEDMSVVLGFTLKKPIHSFETLAAVGASVVEGLGLRHVLMPALVDKVITLEGPEGPEDWHLAALGFLGVLEQVIELDPDYDPTTALPKYLKRLAEREAAVTAAAPLLQA